MSINGLMAARDKLMADVPLSGFFTERYGKAARHFVGYKRAANANDYPSICYVPVTAEPPAAVGGMNKERVSLVIGVHEPGVTDDVFDGVSACSTAAGRVLDCLERGTIGPRATLLGEVKVVTDMGTRHPFYEIEISMLLGYR